MPRIPSDPRRLMVGQHAQKLMRRLLDRRRMSATDPLEALGLVAQLQDQLDGYQQRVAYEALELGYKWADVADALGVNTSTAFRRFRMTDEERDQREREWMRENP